VFFLEHISCEFNKGDGCFIIFSLSTIEGKVYPKVFCLFKNGQKKCPKMKRGERLWKNHHL
jgi:hypothetical protein